MLELKSSPGCGLMLGRALGSTRGITEVQAAGHTDDVILAEPPGAYPGRTRLRC